MTEQELRIDSIKNYIEERLSEELTLTELAARANISPFHFQKVFKSIVGETPKQYIVRLRLEAAAHHIVLKPDTTILEVALICGFNSLEAFSRAFKQYYDLSPDKFRKSIEQDKLNILHKKLRNSLYPQNSSPFRANDPNNSKELEIEVVKMRWKKMIYISRSLLDYDSETNGFPLIKKWAEARGLLSYPVEYVGLIRDFPVITALEKCRFLTGLFISEPVTSKDGIVYEEIPPKTYATFTINGNINEVVQHVTQFFTEWLPNSGYELTHSPALVIPSGDPTNTSLKNLSNQIYLGLQAAPLK